MSTELSILTLCATSSEPELKLNATAIFALHCSSKEDGLPSLSTDPTAIVYILLTKPSVAQVSCLDPPLPAAHTKMLPLF